MIESLDLNRLGGRWIYCFQGRGGEDLALEVTSALDVAYDNPY
uniref:Uncharacterized protein n=1 Tax=Parascaris equorum TaxID=6256 RepID=A0A914RNR3_PAREQ